VLGGDSGDDRRDEDVAVCVLAAFVDGGLGGRGERLLGFRRLRDTLARRSRSSIGGRLRGRLGRRRRRGGLVRGATVRDLSADPAEQRPDLDGLALLDEDLGEDARARARHLGIDLVGRDLEQRLVGLDVVADRLEPLRHRPFGDGDSHLRHDDVDCGTGCHQ
jgi:hypothetical protein